MNWYNKFLILSSFRNKLTLLSNKLSTIIFKEVINKTKDDKIVIGQDKQPSLKDYDIIKIVVEIYPNEENVLVTGDWIQEWKTIFIKTRFNYKNKIHYERLSLELNYVLRHELEHGLQTKLDPLTAPSWDNNIPSDIMGRINKNKEYLLNKSEINAFIREFMPKAKKEKLLIEDMLFDFIYKKLFESDRKEIDYNIENKTQFGKELINIFNEVINTYKVEIKKLYSNRKVI